MAKLIIVITLLALVVNCMTWKTCNQVEFCKNFRDKTFEYPKYHVEGAGEELKEGELVYGRKIHLKSDAATPTELQLNVICLKENTFKLEIVGKDEAVDNRNGEILLPHNKNTAVYTENDEKIVLTNGDSEAHVHKAPLVIKFYNKGILVSAVNAKSRLFYKDSKEAISLDVAFLNARHAYGLPEHADSMSLRNTKEPNEDPYRHFNVDYGSYKIKSTEALYGSIGVLYARAPTYVSGVFWYNEGETWIEVDKSTTSQIDAQFMSVTGKIEMYILTGPTLAESVKQYGKLTGVAPLPQYFALGYHQSRYSYQTQQRVLEVVKGFDDAELPLDVMWLDIDYTDNFKYFTWNKTAFPTPIELQNTLKQNHKTLVAIIDPHIKVEDNYDVYEAFKEKYFVKKSDKITNYEAECWAGDSSWIDFLNKEAREKYASFYNTKLEFAGDNIHIWNDMNEPAVFNDDDPDLEKTMPPDNLHLDSKVEHKDVHNIYGLYQVMGTRQGMISTKTRPFILTRSHFAGVQRYAAIWTGDNQATWEDLRISFPMCLTEALAGVSFCGADVGGFAKVPTEELNQRWYQAGAWLPFYRGHSNNEQDGREPYNNPEPVKKRIQAALKQRYAHLPVWYSTFRHHELTGEPVIRPIIYQYPNEDDAAAIDDHILLGENILVAPVLEEGTSYKTVYFPGGETETWFQIDNNYTRFNGTGYHSIPVTLDTVPVFYRGGSIITRKDHHRLASAAMTNDNYTLYVSLNNDGTAKGSLYEDDHKSDEYKNNKTLTVDFTFANHTLTSKVLSKGYETSIFVVKAVIINSPKDILRVETEGDGVSLLYNNDNTTLVLENLAKKLNEDFSVKLLTTSKSSILQLNIVLVILVAIKAILF